MFSNWHCTGAPNSRSPGVDCGGTAVKKGISQILIPNTCQKLLRTEPLIDLKVYSMLPPTGSS